jgi:hypothetical protein
VEPGCGSTCTGHALGGFQNNFNSTATPIGQTFERPYGLETNPVGGGLNNGLVPNPPITSTGFTNCASGTMLDTHLNWDTGDLLDSNPLYVISTDNAMASPPLPGAYNCPTMNALYTTAPNANANPGEISILASTFYTGTSSTFFVQSPFEEATLDGNWTFFSSNGTNASNLGTFGRTDLTSGACVNSPQGSSACRADLMVVGPLTSAVNSAPSCSWTAGVLGGIEVTCNNTNSTTPTLMCVTTNGATPVSNGSGTACSAGFALSPVASGGAEYPGYFNINHSATVKLIAGVNGQADSSVVSYNITVPTQTILSSHFGMQCGPGVSTNCPLVSGVVTWPTSIAVPDVFRIHDAGQGWSSIEPTCATFSGSLCTSPNFNWATFNAEVDAVANHGVLGMVQMLSPPCWTQASCNIADPVYPNGGTAAPTDLGTGPMGSSPNFNAFISTWVAHVTPNGNAISNNIKVFQLWNEWDLCQHWTGTAAQLYALLAYPVQILRASIPGIAITIPSEQYEGTNCQSGNYATDLSTWLNLENTNGRISDYIDWHGYLTLTSSTTNIPETQWATYQVNYLSAQAAIAGWNIAPFFNSETNFVAANGYVCPSAQYTQVDCDGQVVRWQILHDSNGATGLDWYYWNTTIGQTPGSTSNGYYGFSVPYYYAQLYLGGGYFTAPAALLSGTTWTAPFVESNATVALWAWTTSEAGATYTVPAGFTRYRALDGTFTIVTPGQNITVTTSPIMLEQSVGVSPWNRAGPLI